MTNIRLTLFASSNYDIFYLKIYNEYMNELQNIIKNVKNINFSKMPLPEPFHDVGIKNYKLNKNGIPINNKGIIISTTVAAYGLDLYYEYYKTKDEDKKILLKNIVKYISKNIKKYKKVDGFLMNIKVPAFNIYEAKWFSGLTNIWAALNLLYGAYLFEENKNIYLTQALKLINAIITPIKYGGSLDIFGDVPWYEEYPSLNNSNSHVLNGMIFIIAGLKIFYDSLSLQVFYNLYNLGVLSVLSKIDVFDS